MKEPILTLAVDRKAGEIQPNPYGYDRIHIWCFNYDGKGTAIISFDEAPEFESIYGNDLYYVLFGDPGSGVRWYHRLSPGTPDASTESVD